MGRTPRLDAPALLRELAEVTGVVLAFDGPCRGGQVGAAYVRWPNGLRSVLTHSPSNAASRDLISVARAAGIPAPRYELIAELPSGVAAVQELLPGRTPSPLTAHTVVAMLEINQACRGLLADRHELPAPSLHLVSSGPGFCLHETLAGHDRRTASLLGDIRKIGAAFPAETLAGPDLTHFDFHPENVLVNASGDITGIVDWDAVHRSNADLDLWTLRFDLAHRAPHLSLLLEPFSGRDATASACWAHMALRMVDWSIRHFSASETASWVDIAFRLRP